MRAVAPGTTSHLDSLVQRLRLELGVLAGRRCRICYEPLESEGLNVCGRPRCTEQAAFEKELHGL